MDSHEDVEYQPVEAMDLVGGELCLDFANTGSARDAGPFRERLKEYGDLLTWGVRTGALGSGQADRLRRAGAADPELAAAALERARALREAIYRVFRARESGAVPEPADLALLQQRAAAAAAAQQLVAAADGFELEWPETDELDRAWWPAATSALALLISGDAPRVKQCASENCNWLFLDVSKNRSRRWCEMRECGNRAKARRHYARRKTQG